MRSNAVNFRHGHPTSCCARAARTSPCAERTTLAISDWLPFEDVEQQASAVLEEPIDLPDAAARARAVDPAHNVVLEASAGTGKTHVLVGRYLNLLSRG